MKFCAYGAGWAVLDPARQHELPPQLHYLIKSGRLLGVDQGEGMNFKVRLPDGQIVHKQYLEIREGDELDQPYRAYDEGETPVPWEAAVKT